MTIYTIHKWYRTAPFSKCKKIKKKRREREREKSLCFSLLLHSRMSINKQKNEYIRSLRRLTSSFKILKYGSRLAMADGWSLDYKKQKTPESRIRTETWSTVSRPLPPSGASQSIWRFAYELPLIRYYYYYYYIWGHSSCHGISVYITV